MTDTGFWVEGGQLAYPVEEITIAGNLGQMFRDIVAIGADERDFSAPGAAFPASYDSSDALLQAFDANVERGFGSYVYNVANAAALVEWEQAYGDAVADEPNMLGAPRWTETDASVLFGEAPHLGVLHPAHDCADRHVREHAPARGVGMRLQPGDRVDVRPVPPPHLLGCSHGARLTAPLTLASTYLGCGDGAPSWRADVIWS